jgi:hypothetical protein
MSIQDRQLASAVDEYADVLQRPENRLATGLSEADVEGFLAAFASAAEGVDVNFSLAPATSTLSLGCQAARHAAARAAEGVGAMSMTAYPLKLPASVKAPQADL